MNLSYWVDSTLPTADRPLSGDLSTSVCVIGAGLVGVTTAWLLRTQGHDVVLIDMHEVGQGVTGYTTGKVTSGHGLIYSQLASNHGRETAERYARVNQAALAWMRDLVTEHSIGCDWEERDNYVYVVDPQRARDIEREVEAAASAGLPVRHETDIDLPFEVAAAIRLEDQAQFHARRYVLSLAQMFREAGGQIFDRTRALSVSEDGDCTVTTSGGEIVCEKVVISTHYPFTDRSLLFARVHPKRSYALTAPLKGPAPSGMYI
ncbi:MAG: NAD(P)/FAD-dependent oxidoreductase, partial [Actinomycetota bacterium]